MREDAGVSDSGEQWRLFVPTTNIESKQGYGFPSELARVVADRWQTMVVGQSYVLPKLPPRRLLTNLLETIFFASLETEEGRPLCFTVCCIPEGAGVVRQDSEQPVETWTFAEARPFSIQELRRLAATTNLNSSGILVTFSKGAAGRLSIGGLVNVGFSWSSARRGFTYHYEEPPLALTVRADGPGRLSVYQGQFLVATLGAGEVRASTTEASMDTIGIHKLLLEGLQQIEPLIASTEHEDPHQTVAFLWLAYLNTIFSVVNTVLNKGHGGALVFARHGSQAWTLPENILRVKYRMTDSFTLRDRFVTFMDERNRFSDLLTLHEMASKSAPTSDQIEAVAAKFGDGSRRLASTAAFIGGLSAVDGALILTNSLEVIGFGAEILLDRIPQSVVHEIVGNPAHKESSELDSEQFGMRHRSAMRLCAASEGIAVFVVSQDGGVSLVWKEEGEVFFKKGISTLNADMVLA